MTPEEQRELVILCGGCPDIKSHLNVKSNSIIFLPEELSDYTAVVESKERERCAIVADSFYQNMRQYTTNVPDIGGSIRELK